MKNEISWLAGLRIKVHGVKAAVFEKFDSGEGGAKADVKLAPLAGFAQGEGKTLDAVAQEPDRRNSSQEAPFPEDQV